MAAASSSTALEASGSSRKAPFSRIAPSRSSAGARLKYRARRSTKRATSSLAGLCAASPEDAARAAIRSAATSAAGPTLRDSGPCTCASNSARNDAETPCDFAILSAASRRLFALSPANSALIEGSQGCTRRASARVVGVRTCGDSSATNASRAKSDAAASDLDPKSSPHRVSHVPIQRRYAPSAANAASSMSALLWSIAATSPSFSIQLLRSPSSVAASVRTEPAGKRARVSGETAGARGGDGGMAASRAATSAAMSYLYAPTNSSVAALEEETAFELCSAAGGEYTVPSVRAGGTSNAGWYDAAETVVVVAVEVRAPAETALFQSSPALDGESLHEGREPPREDDAASASTSASALASAASRADRDLRCSPQRLVSLVNRAFVRSAALCSLAKVALTRFSNAAYGSGSGGGGGEEKSGARTKLSPGSGVSNAVFPGSIPRGDGGGGGTGGGGGGGGIIDGVNGA